MEEAGGSNPPEPTLKTSGAGWPYRRAVWRFLPGMTTFGSRLTGVFTRTLRSHTIPCKLTSYYQLTLLVDRAC